MSNVEERRRNFWQGLDSGMLQEHAKAVGEPVDDYGADDLDWFYVDALPVSFLGSAEEWRDFWAEQSSFHDTDALARWEPLLRETILEPVVVGLYGRNGSGDDLFGSWDGLHRIAATVLSGRTCVPAVLGVLKGVPLADLPDVVRILPELFALEASRTDPGGTAPGLP